MYKNLPTCILYTLVDFYVRYRARIVVIFNSVINRSEHNMDLLSGFVSELIHEIEYMQAHVAEKMAQDNQLIEEFKDS